MHRQRRAVGSGCHCALGCDRAWHSVALVLSAFALLPTGARLINVARGAIVEEDAMIEALRSGQLGGAYLDVVAEEPLPAESPLWEFPNVLVTPHNSSISASYADRSAEMFFANLVRWGRGEPLQNFVG